MPYSTAGKNAMLDALGALAAYAALFDEAAAITSVTGAASTDILTKVGHGLSNGDLVVLRSLTGGAGLTEEYSYFVVGVNGNDFQLSLTSGGGAVNFTTDVTSVSVVKLVEISGGSPAYARKSVTYSAAAGGVMAASNQPAFDVPAAATIDYAGFYSAVTAGILYGIDAVTPETFAAQGTYTLTSVSLDLNS